MALTINNLKMAGVSGHQAAMEFDIVPDASWLAAGESLTPTDVGLGQIDHISFSNASGYVFDYDHSNDLLLAYYADYDAGADGVLIAVADTTDISAVTVKARAYGVGA